MRQNGNRRRDRGIEESLGVEKQSEERVRRQESERGRLVRKRGRRGEGLESESETEGRGSGTEK